MALTRALQLTGTGLVDAMEISAVSLGEGGGAPCFNEAVAQSRIDIRSGCDIGTVRQHAFQADGSRMEFVSGYRAAATSV